MDAVTSKQRFTWMTTKCLAYLVLFQAVLKNVLDDKAAGLTQSNLMPHASKRFVDVAHDLRWRVAPAQLEQLLPNMASIAVDHSLWNTAQ
jgi:hypothetical protein